MNALDWACETIADIFGSCPYALYDWHGPNCTHEKCIGAMKQMGQCWRLYFVEKAFVEKADEGRGQLKESRVSLFKDGDPVEKAFRWMGFYDFFRKRKVEWILDKGPFVVPDSYIAKACVPLNMQYKLEITETWESNDNPTEEDVDRCIAIVNAYHRWVVECEG